MLSISPIRNVDYYIDISKDDYYTKGEEPPGQWSGSASRLLGLQGEVITDDYKAIMAGKHPGNDNHLRQNSSEKMRKGWDCTFSAPKSVSIAWARAEPDLREQIQKSHSRAVMEAIKFLEEHAGYTRRGTGGIRKEKVNGFVVAAFEHSTSRAQDPQLHTHALIANIAPRSDGYWGTIDSHYLYQWHRAAGAIYRSELANQIEKLHLKIEKDEHSFHVSEIPKDICEHFSKRSKEIKEHLDELKINHSVKARNIAALSSRVSKENVAREALFAIWESELDELGYSNEKLKLSLNENKRLEHSSLQELFRDDNIKFEEIEAQLLETRSTFREQNLYKTTAELSQTKRKDRNDIELICENFIKSEQIIELTRNPNQERVFTTKKMVELERSVIQQAKKLSSFESHKVDQFHIEKVLTENYKHLSDEQIEAILQTCEKGDFAIYQGSAGTGKTTSLECLKDIYREKNTKVYGAALAKSASDNLFNEAGIESFTIDKILSEYECGKIILPKQSVLIVDESSQVSISKLNRLLRLSNENELKLILVGDDKQLDAIEHGGSLRYLSLQEVIGATKIETIRRQREMWAKQIVADFRDGNASTALENMSQRGLINFSNNSEKTKLELVTAWHQYKEKNPKKESIMLAQRWTDVNDLNKLAREGLKLFGYLSKEDVPINCSVSNKHFKLEIAVGDQIRLTKNNYRLGLTNGERGVITEIKSINDEHFLINLKTSNGKEKIIDTSQYCDLEKNVYMVHSYAMTIYSSQGLTVDGDAFVYYSTGMNRANSYVALSRHKDKPHLYVNRAEIDEYNSSNESEKINTDSQRTDTLAKLMCKENSSFLSIEHLQEQKVSSEKNTEFEMIN
jgi:conjugative relaxase-like TrwC/TraI family protein